MAKVMMAEGLVCEEKTNPVVQLHGWVKGSKFFGVSAVLLRIALGLGFIWPSLPKILGLRFTLLGPETKVGFFFEAMYQSGIYWNFLGWAQMAAGVLLLVPRTRTIGALLYLPIILNIFLITVGIGFQGTPYVTGLMLLGVLALLFYDGDRIIGALPVLAPRKAV